MTPREKAVSILGHQEGCRREGWIDMGNGPPPCHCYSDQLHVLIAAERGTLRKDHTWVDRETFWICSGCRDSTDYDPTPKGWNDPGPCAEPLTPALAWELLVEWKIDLVWGYECGMWVASHDHQTTDGVDYFEQQEEDPIEAVARLYLALAEAKLLRRDDALPD